MPSNVGSFQLQLYF